jgi:RNA polymerase sigma-70 factor (ECF subfamily)
VKLYGIVQRILGRQDLADAVLEDVYVRVWQRAGDFDEASGSPDAWLARLARNSALDDIKRAASGSPKDLPSSPREPGAVGSASERGVAMAQRMSQRTATGRDRDRAPRLPLRFDAGADLQARRPASGDG